MMPSTIHNLSDGIQHCYLRTVRVHVVYSLKPEKKKIQNKFAASEEKGF